MYTNLTEIELIARHHIDQRLRQSGRLVRTASRRRGASTP